MNQMVLRLALVLLLVFAYALAEQPTEKQAFAVWDGACLTDVSRTSETRMEAPFEDGKPNLHKIKLIHVNAKYQPECYRIEVR